MHDQVSATLHPRLGQGIGDELGGLLAAGLVQTHHVVTRRSHDNLPDTEQLPAYLQTLNTLSANSKDRVINTYSVTMLSKQA